MPNNVRFVDALEYFEENDCGLANCNYDPIEMVEELQTLGCAVHAEIEEGYDGEERFTDSLFVTLPGKITADHLVYIAKIRPDEISEEEDGRIRLWWD